MYLFIEKKKIHYRRYILFISQDLVAFAGLDEMASEVFSVQLPLSLSPLYSNLGGTLQDHGIVGPSTLYVLWLSSDEIQVKKKNVLLHYVIITNGN